MIKQRRNSFVIGPSRGISIAVSLPFQRRLREETSNDHHQHSLVRQLVLQNAVACSVESSSCRCCCCCYPSSSAVSVVRDSVRRWRRCGGSSDDNNDHEGIFSSSLVLPHDSFASTGSGDRRLSLRASLSHEQDGSMAAIASFRERAVFPSNNNSCGIDVVLPSRISAARRRWGTDKFASRWLGRQNLDILRGLPLSFPHHHHLKTTTTAGPGSCWNKNNSNHNNNDSSSRISPNHTDLACAVLWGWRESIIKAQSSFNVLASSSSSSGVVVSPPPQRQHSECSQQQHQQQQPRPVRAPARAFHLSQVKLDEVFCFVDPSSSSSSSMVSLSCPSLRIVGQDAAEDCCRFYCDDGDSARAAAAVVVGDRFDKLQLGAVVLSGSNCRNSGLFSCAWNSPVVVCWAFA